MLQFEREKVICPVLVLLLWAALCIPVAAGRNEPEPVKKDIRDLSNHFNTPGADISPWIFVPESNVKEISTTESPGLLSVWQAGKGQEVKGILKDPIKL